ncbi:ABC transporter ATP-binding protein [Marinicrinis lubricantis]|uniref:ABC transporter ATP-binding protein n=1 Tax=Marinicrinis lubricantis TaxID=2086470 RepID=A0ABW1IQD3_9BACL
MQSPVIDIRNLTKVYGHYTAVNQLNLTIQQGEIFGLLGPNGAGKSTTILMLLGLTEPTSGSAVVCGMDPTRYPVKVKQKVGYLPDDVGFYEDRTGLENLLYTAYLNGIPPKEARDRAEKLLKRVDLESAAHNKTGQYSRGMRQRLGLADVLMKDPEVIILDEPTLGIDPKGVQELLQFIGQLSREDGLTVLLSSHHLHQVQQICDRVGIFVKGKLLAAGDIGTLSRTLFSKEDIRIEAHTSPLSRETAEELAQIEAVKRHESREDGTTIFYCEEDVSSRIAETIIRSGSSLYSLVKKQYGLDEIYHRYFSGGDSHDELPGQPA